MFSPHPNHLAARLRSIEATPWTEAEDQILIDGYKEKTAAKLADELKRTQGAVVTRIQILGLKKQPPYTEEEKDQIFTWIREGKKTPWMAGQLDRPLRGLRASIANWRKHGQR